MTTTKPETAMQYLLMIYDAEKQWADMPEAKRNAILGEYIGFTKAITESGHFVAGDALQPSHTATMVRVKDGKVTRTDGPFAETREQLGGYYLINAKDLDEATLIAAKIPSAAHGIGCIEVRPVLQY